jgi:FeS assembly ATPase SufC
MSKLLIVKNLHAATAEKELLHGIDLRVDKGETIVVVGPNGAGKSTLARALMGVADFDYSGLMKFGAKDILSVPCEERAKLGMFLSYQDPIAIPGLPVSEMLRSALETRGVKMRLREFKLQLAKNLEKLELSPFAGERELNVDFSGGEKKKLEILQMLTLQPKLAILDEIDSGLDIDAARLVSNVIRDYQKETECGLAIVTHNMRILQSLNVDRVYVLRDGEISCVGDVGLLEEIRKHGFKNV